MDEQAVREHAQTLCDALVAGDIDRVIEQLSAELRHNTGEVIALLPLPCSAAEIDSIEQTGSGFKVLVRLTSETEEVVLQTRWKERDGEPTVIEASHLSRAETAAPEGAGEDETAAAEEAG